MEFVDVFRQIVDEAIPTMREIQQSGKARFIGITGLQLKVMTIPSPSVRRSTPLLSYCRYNLLFNDMDDLLTDFASQRKIGLINASPVHMGVLPERGAPAWHPAPKEVWQAGAAHRGRLRTPRNKKVGDIALRFCLGHPYAATTLVGMSTVEHVERNIAALECEPPADLIAEIHSLRLQGHESLVAHRLA